MNTLDLEKGPTLQLDRIDRASVRRLVEDYTLAAQAAGARGENIHQWALDQQDRVTQYASSLSDEDADLFCTLYSEEMDASSKAMLDKAQELNMQTAQVHLQTAQNAGNFATWISIVVFFVFLIGMIKVIKG